MPKANGDSSACVIRRVTAEDRRLLVEWADGHVSRFHHIWLRDNCRCAACGDTSTGIRFLRVTDISPDIQPVETMIGAGERLVIGWAPDGHETSFDAAWLRRHCYMAAERASRRHRPALWDASLRPNLPHIAYAEISDASDGLATTFEHILAYGFTVIRGVSTAGRDTEAVVSRFGFIQETNFGRMIDISTASSWDLDANKQMALPPHTDEAFRYAPPGLSFLHMVTPSPDGGGATILVDGFKVAETLRENDPESFELLTFVPQRFHRYLPGNADLRAEGVPITLDADGNVVGVRYGDRNTAPLDVREELVEAVYAASRAFLDLIYSQAFHIEFRLEAGDLLLFDNQRVLHGRTAFDAAGGVRHIRQGAVDREEFHSRVRLLYRRQGRGEADLVLPRGALG